MFYHDKTIAAIATPPGKGGVALIRISGDNALAIADICFHPKNKISLIKQEERRAVYGYIIDDGKIIDDGIATVFFAPHSYTGEDVVEISCHGGRYVTGRVLAAVLKCGAAMAEAGEFTRRAFASGKLSLSEAEAVADLLDAGTEGQLELAIGVKSGHLKNEINEIYESVCALVSAMHAKVDFPDEDLAELSGSEIESTLTRAISRCGKLCEGYKTAHAVNEGIKTVICGRPNTGKSMLYNVLAGEELAIVTDKAGTTRDMLRASVTLGRVQLNLIDTAGIRKTGDEIESIGVEKSKDAMKSAELILAVFDAAAELSAEDREVIAAVKGLPSPKIALLNKSDLRGVIDKKLIGESFEYVIEISAKELRGLDELRELVNKLYTDEKLNLSDDAVISNARQYAAVTEAKNALVCARTTHGMGLTPDLVGVELENALGALGELDGREVSENVVNEIFSRFCVGK